MMCGPSDLLVLVSVCLESGAPGHGRAGSRPRLSKCCWMPESAHFDTFCMEERDGKTVVQSFFQSCYTMLYSIYTVSIYIYMNIVI